MEVYSNKTGGALSLLLTARECVLSEGRSQRDNELLLRLFMIYKYSGSGSSIKKEDVFFSDDVFVARSQWESRFPDDLGVDLIFKSKNDKIWVTELVQKVWGCTPYSNTIVETENYQLTIPPKISGKNVAKPLLIYVDARMYELNNVESKL